MLLLAERGWTQATLARAVSVTPSAIQQLLSGKTKNSRLLPRIARALNASEEYISGTSPERYSAVSGDISPEDLAKALSGKLFGYDKSRQKKLYDDPSLNAATYNQVYDPYWLKSQVARVSPELFENNGSDYIPPLATLSMATDAMSPTLLRGDQLIVSTASRRVVGHDGIWSISYGGLQMVRRLMPLPQDRGYRVSADNPTAPTFEAPKEDIELRGVVFWVGRMVS